ncbi:MAG: aminopeptidase [Acholeplasmatales bacterium]|jgi:aminopeptidase|nr:aminopeptidase [Acholeplasmatales bacterium]
MSTLSLLKKLAVLAVRVGANVQKKQLVVVRCSTISAVLARLIVAECYKAKASNVIVQWRDEYVSKESLKHMDSQSLVEVPQYVIDQNKYYIDNNACFINIVSTIPGINDSVKSSRIKAFSEASMKHLSFLQNHTMSNKAQWTIVAYPNKVWAKKVFPNDSANVALKKLQEAILNASRVYENNDPIKDWEIHNNNLTKYNQTMNNYNFKELHFENSIGTSLVVGLVKDHIWCGGGEHSTKGVYFNPNIPTEETFTMPDKNRINGKVYSTKPLDYQGKLIEDFYLEFKDGKVINFDAKKERESLENLLNTDEGSRSLGEVALISYDSPINNTGILFYNTLFDENASCHLAIGRAYPMNIKRGVESSIEELKVRGYNYSNVHVDFMFGSRDMSIKGVTWDNEEIEIFRNGNFLF